MSAINSVSKGSGPFSIDTEIFGFFIAIADIFVVFLSGYLAYTAGAVETFKTYNLQVYITCMSLYAVFNVFLFHINSLYAVESIGSYRVSFPKIIVLSILSLIVVALLIIGLRVSGIFSKDLVLLWFLFSITGFLLVQFTARKCLTALAYAGWFTRNIAIVGAGSQGTLLLEQIHKINHPWIKVVGIYDDRTERMDSSLDPSLLGGGIEALIATARGRRIDDILVALPWGAEDRVLKIMSKLQVLPVNIRLCPESICYKLSVSGYDRKYGIPLLNTFEKPISGWDSVLKSIEDKVLGSLILTLISPLLLVIAVLIKLDSPGPVFFRQKRYGFNNQLIEVYKFRSMYADKLDHSASKLTERDDPCVTRLGKILRKTSLDELPQFINVVKGEMSIVGPRPHALQAKACGVLYEDIVAQYAARHKVKPGITGLAQVNGWRGNTDTEEKIQKRVENDIVYINEWSLLLDFKIILKTLFVVFADENAY